MLSTCARHMYVAAHRSSTKKLACNERGGGVQVAYRDPHGVADGKVDIACAGEDGGQPRQPLVPAVRPTLSFLSSAPCCWCVRSFMSSCLLFSVCGTWRLTYGGAVQPQLQQHVDFVCVCALIDFLLLLNSLLPRIAIRLCATVSVET